MQEGNNKIKKGRKRNIIHFIHLTNQDQNKVKYNFRESTTQNHPRAQKVVASKDL